MDGLTEGILIVAGSLVVALGGMAVVRKKIKADLLAANHEVAGYMLAIIGTLYAVLLGLVVVNVQAKFEQAKMMAVTEANCLSDLYHLSAVFEEKSRDAIHEEIHSYAIAAHDQDWATVSTGESKEATIPFYRRLWRSINNLDLKNSKQEANYSCVLSEMNQLADARRFRMVASCQRLSPVLWMVLIVGELLIVWFTYFFAVENATMQTIMTGFVVLFLSLNIYLVFLYDNPYRSALGARNAGSVLHPEWFVPEGQSPRTDSESSKPGAE